MYDRTVIHPRSGKDGQRLSVTAFNEGSLVDREKTLKTAENTGFREHRGHAGRSDVRDWSMSFDQVRVLTGPIFARTPTPYAAVRSGLADAVLSENFGK
jgi:hypothetical protein